MWNGFFEQGKELSSFMKGGKFRNYPSDY